MKKMPAPASVALTTACRGPSPCFKKIEVIPAMGMNIFQIWADLPEQNDVPLLVSPSLPQAFQRVFDQQDQFRASQAFLFGGALLAPFANRIRGQATASGEITTVVAGRTIRLAANWSSGRAGGERHAIHGLILDQAAQVLECNNQAGVLRAVLHAGNFGGRWFSSCELRFEIKLEPSALGIEVLARNTGNEELPMGMGWHPYFAIPSGQRERARIRLPGRFRAETNNPQDVFPTGKLMAIAGSGFDFSAAKALGDIFLDESYTDLLRDADGTASAWLEDDGSHYGLRIRAVSPQVRAFHIYAPRESAFVAIEPQFNLADPYNPVWENPDTGMVLLKPGESVSYRVRLELYVPQPGGGTPLSWRRGS